MANPADTSPPPAASPRHEPDDVYIAGVLWFGVGLVVLGVVSAFVVVGLQSWLQGREAAAQPALPALVRERPVMPKALKNIPAPVLQQKDQAALEELRKKEEGELTGPPRWIDRQKGVVGIPIERAMELVVKEKR